MVASPLPDQNPTLQRLEEQISWYNSKSTSYRKAFNGLKLLTLIGAAAIPFLPVLPVEPQSSRMVTAALGALIVVIEGIQQLYQLQMNWILYRSTCENLKHEKYLFLGGAGAYASAQNPHLLLAERIESLVSQEHARWTNAQAMTPPRSANQSKKRHAALEN